MVLLSNLPNPTLFLDTIHLQEVGIDQVIKGNKMSSVTKKVEFEMYPKNELITSHSMRRSFATNYFGKIETPILMEITGHSRESTFLSYIGENPNKDAVADVFMERLRRLGNESG